MSESCRRNSPRAACLRSSAGFTLLETLVVVALIGLLAAVTLPRFEAMYRQLAMDLDRDSVEAAIAALPRNVAIDGREAVLSDLALQKPDDADAKPDDGADGETDVAAPPKPDPNAPRQLQLPLPESWEVTIAQLIIYHASGFCEGGEILFHDHGAELHYRLDSPICAPVLVEPQ